MLTLPKVTKGGLSWLRSLLKQTAGDKLCWGDIHAALVKAADETVADNIKNAIEHRMGNRMNKTQAIHLFRAQLEDELRARFLCIMTDELLSIQMKDGEDYYSYKQRATNLYHDVTGEVIQPGTGMAVMLRSAMVKGMPKNVQEALPNVMGLYNKNEEEFNAHCNHQITKYQNEKKETGEKKQELEQKYAEISNRTQRLEERERL